MIEGKVGGKGFIKAGKGLTPGKTVEQTRTRKGKQEPCATLFLVSPLDSIAVQIFCRISRPFEIKRETAC